MFFSQLLTSRVFCFFNEAEVRSTEFLFSVGSAHVERAALCLFSWALLQEQGHSLCLLALTSKDNLYCTTWDNAQNHRTTTEELGLKRTSKITQFQPPASHFFSLEEEPVRKEMLGGQSSVLGLAEGFSWSSGAAVTHLPFLGSWWAPWKTAERTESLRGTESRAAFTATSQPAMWGDRDEQWHSSGMDGRLGFGCGRCKVELEGSAQTWCEQAGKACPEEAG